jgi:geranylgeranyl diphosphate synthase, type I
MCAITTHATSTGPPRGDLALIGRIDQVLRDFFAGRVDTDDIANWPTVLAATAAFVMGGGKRLRPRFCYWGWRGAGGGEDNGVLSAAASLEMLHAFALIHDDIMDASDVRRGRPTLHRSLTGLHEGNDWIGLSGRFGVNAAILCGDLCIFWSDELLHGSGLPAARLAAARPLLNEMRVELCAGQFFDLGEQASGGSLEGALRVIRYKAARYTVERPLQLGGILAGADAALLRAYSDYGIPIGEAFQLRDDLLGVFGDPAVTGKSVRDDLRDGKATVLIALTRQGATPAQRGQLDLLHGNADLDDEGAAAVRDIIVATGALDRVEEMIAQRTAAALAALDRADMTGEARKALSDLAVLATSRHV